MTPSWTNLSLQDTGICFIDVVPMKYNDTPAPVVQTQQLPDH